MPMVPSHDMSQKKLILLDLSAQSMTGEERKREERRDSGRDKEIEGTTAGGGLREG